MSKGVKTNPFANPQLDRPKRAFAALTKVIDMENEKTNPDKDLLNDLEELRDEITDAIVRISTKNVDLLDKLRDYADWLKESNKDNIEYEDETEADSKKE